MREHILNRELECRINKLSNSSGKVIVLGEGDDSHIYSTMNMYSEIHETSFINLQDMKDRHDASKMTLSGRVTCISGIRFNPEILSHSLENIELDKNNVTDIIIILNGKHKYTGRLIDESLLSKTLMQVTIETYVNYILKLSIYPNLTFAEFLADSNNITDDYINASDVSYIIAERYFSRILFSLYTELNTLKEQVVYNKLYKKLNECIVENNINKTLIIMEDAPTNKLRLNNLNELGKLSYDRSDVVCVDCTYERQLELVLSNARSNFKDSRSMMLDNFTSGLRDNRSIICNILYAYSKHKDNYFNNILIVSHSRKETYSISLEEYTIASRTSKYFSDDELYRAITKQKAKFLRDNSSTIKSSTLAHIRLYFNRFIECRRIEEQRSESNKHVSLKQVNKIISLYRGSIEDSIESKQKMLDLIKFIKS